MKILLMATFVVASLIALPAMAFAPTQPHTQKPNVQEENEKEYAFCFQPVVQKCTCTCPTPEPPVDDSTDQT